MLIARYLLVTILTIAAGLVLVMFTPIEPGHWQTVCPLIIAAMDAGIALTRPVGSNPTAADLRRISLLLTFVNLLLGGTLLGVAVATGVIVTRDLQAMSDLGVGTLALILLFVTCLVLGLTRMGIGLGVRLGKRAGAKLQ